MFSQCSYQPSSSATIFAMLQTKKGSSRSMTTTAYLPTRQFSKTLFFSPCNHRKQQSVCRGQRSLRNVSLHGCYASTLWVLCTLDVKPFRLPITCWLLFIKGRMAWKITDRASQLALLSWMSSNEACCQVISPPPHLRLRIVTQDSLQDVRLMSRLVLAVCNDSSTKSNQKLGVLTVTPTGSFSFFDEYVCEAVHNIPPTIPLQAAELRSSIDSPVEDLVSLETSSAINKTAPRRLQSSLSLQFDTRLETVQRSLKVQVRTVSQYWVR